jgi:hypothetical protein
VFNIGKSFDLRLENFWLCQLEKLEPDALDYVMNIDPKLWRCAAWTKDQTLPP